jgi:Tetratricopeptide repeat
MKKRPLVFAALLSLTGSAAFAQAPPPSPAPAAAPAGEADAHFKRGVELYKDADFSAALIEFRRAYEIDPRFQALYNIGETYDQLQDYADALKTLEKYLKDGGAQVSAGRREEVQRSIDKLRTRVANLEVTTNLPDVEIAIDDVPVGKTPLAGPILVSAGRRRLTATRAGRPAVAQVVEIAGGDTKKLALTLTDDAPVPEAPPAKVPAAPWVVTGVLVASAIVTGSLALVSSSSLKSDLAVYPHADPNLISSDHSKTFGLALTTDVLIGAAVVAGAVSIYFTATAGKRKPADDKSAPPPAAPAAGRDAGPRVSIHSPFAPGHLESPAEGSAPFVRLGAGPRSVLLSGSF